MFQNNFCLRADNFLEGGGGGGRGKEGPEEPQQQILPTNTLCKLVHRCPV